jgi:hypothetical protein
MKTPLDTMSGTVWAGLILTVIFVLIAFNVPRGWVVDLVLIAIIWLGMFGLLRKPS